MASFEHSQSQNNPSPTSSSPPVDVSQSPATVILRISVNALKDVASPELMADIGRNSLLPGTTILNVLEGELSKFAPLQADVSWLQTVAHGIFDPIKRDGVLYTHVDGSFGDWLHRERDNTSWQPVELNTPLEARIYEYVPNGAFKVTLPRILIRQTEDESATSKGQAGNSASFRSAISARDSRCIVSGEPFLPRSSNQFTFSHILPKRLQTKIGPISARYVDVPGLQVLRRFDAQTGVLLYYTVARPFEYFELGLFQPAENNPSEFTVHLFGRWSCVRYLHCTKVVYPSDANPTSPFAGEGTEDKADSSFQTGQEYPPAGFFLWHYVQCVLHRFATPEFLGLSDVEFKDVPTRYRNDDWDSEDEELDAQAPQYYPSEGWDNLLAAAARRQFQREILGWQSGVVEAANEPSES